MSRNQIDLVVVVALILVPFMGAITLGTIGMQVNVFGNFAFSDVLWSASSVELTAATLLSIAGTAWIVATNEINGSSYETYELVILAVTLGIVPAYVLIPAVRTFAGIDAISFILVMVQSGGAVLVSYVE
jgi:hypothetical protein